MSKFKCTFYILSILFLAACNSNNIFEEHSNEFTNYSWQQNDTLKFSPKIVEPKSPCTLSLSVRHIYGFTGKAMRVKIELTSPSNEKMSQSYVFKVVNERNEYLGDCAGDFCDLVVPIDTNFIFREKGEYNFQITQDMQVEQIPNLLQIGLRIDRNETKQ